MKSGFAYCIIWVKVLLGMTMNKGVRLFCGLTLLRKHFTPLFVEHLLKVSKKRLLKPPPLNTIRLSFKKAPLSIWRGVGGEVLG